MEDVAFDTMRYMAENGPYGDDYVSNLMFNTAAVTVAGGKFAGRIFGETRVVEKVNEYLDDKIGESEDESGVEETYLESAGYGAMGGGFVGGFSDYLTQEAAPEYLNNKTTSAAVTGGVVGAAGEKALKDGIVKAAKVLE